MNLPAKAPAACSPSLSRRRRISPPRRTPPASASSTPRRPPASPSTRSLKSSPRARAEFAQAREDYVFRQSVKIDTLDEDSGKIDGEYQQVTDITFSPEGRREEHVVFAPQNTLERIMMTPADFDEIEHRLPFILTTDDLPQYDVKYLGRQKVDELDTYVFEAGPKTWSRTTTTSRARSGSTSRTCRSSSSTADRPPGHAPRPRRPAAALHHLLRTGRRKILVPHLHQGRGRAALRRAERRAQRGRSHPLNRALHRLQALPRHQPNHLQRPGHHQQQGL